MDIEQPIYTVLPATAGPERDSQIRFVGSTPYYVGSQCEFVGWPIPELIEPANENAKRVAAYYARNRGDMFLPYSPFSETFGEIILPAVLRRLDPLPGDAPWTTRPLPLPSTSDRADTAMPQYTSRSVEHFGGRCFNSRGGRVQIPAGEKFIYLGWPHDSFEDANDAGRDVKAYYAANGRHPDLLTSPWCEYRRGLCLHQLHPAMPLHPEETSAARQAAVPPLQPKERVRIGNATMVL